MSVVYRARDIRLNRTVAIKVLPPELAYDPAVRTRFTREAQTSAQLSHAHIVPIYDVGDRDGIAYFVMAFVPGRNLATHLAHEPKAGHIALRAFLPPGTPGEGPIARFANVTVQPGVIAPPLPASPPGAPPQPGVVAAWSVSAALSRRARWVDSSK